MSISSAGRRGPARGRVAKATLLLLGAMLVLTLPWAAGAQGVAAVTVVEQRAVAGIERVVMRAIGELIVREGQAEHLQIEAEPELLSMIASEVRDGTLYLGIRPGLIRTTAPLRFHLTVDRLDGLELASSANVRVGALHADAFLLTLTGSGNVEIEALEARRFEARLTGSGNVIIGGGHVGRQSLLLRGSGNYLAGAMGSRTARLSIEGSGNATVHAGTELLVRIAGSGNVRYHGNPLVEQVVAGSGRVARAGGW